MAGGQDDTAGCLFSCNSQLGRRRGSQSDVHHIVTHTHQGAAYNLLYHMTAQTGVTAYYNLVVSRQCCAPLGGIGCSETNDIYGVKTLTYASAYRAADTGDTLY